MNQEMDELEEEVQKKDAERQESNKTAGVEFVEVEKVVEIPIEVVKEVEIVKEVIKEVPVLKNRPKPKTRDMLT